MTRQEIRSRVQIELRRRGMLDYYDPGLLDQMIEESKNAFSEDVGGWMGLASQDSVSGTERYLLPTRLITLDRVEFGDTGIIDRVYTRAIKDYTVTAAGGTWVYNFDTGY